MNLTINGVTHRIAMTWHRHWRHAWFCRDCELHGSGFLNEASALAVARAEHDARAEAA